MLATIQTATTCTHHIQNASLGKLQAANQQKPATTNQPTKTYDHNIQNASLGNLQAAARQRGIEVNQTQTNAPENSDQFGRGAIPTRGGVFPPSLTVGVSKSPPYCRGIEPPLTIGVSESPLTVGRFDTIEIGNLVSKRLDSKGGGYAWPLEIYAND